MKKIDNNIKPKDIRLKKVYVTPQLGSIKLLADQVLTTCMSSTGSDCTSGPCRTLGN